MLFLVHFMLTIYTVQSRLDSVERNILDKLKDVHDRQKETQNIMQTNINASAKKQQALTYITWGLIAIAIIVFIIIKTK